MVRHLNLVYGYNILLFMTVVYESLLANVFLRFGKGSGRAIALPALVVPSVLLTIIVFVLS